MSAPLSFMAPSSTALVLASKSATRVMLMRNAGLAFTIDPATVDERALEAPLLAQGADPDVIARELAIAKALDVSARHPGALVVGADQTLGAGHQRFHKPESLTGARAQLSQLRGITHQLHSAAALARDGVILWSTVATASLTMRAFSDAFLDAYLAVAGDRVATSVGGYQLEGPGLQLFDTVAGDYFTILGLPLVPLLDRLRTEGVVLA
jgi:septum formation protein